MPSISPHKDHSCCVHLWHRTFYNQFLIRLCAGMKKMEYKGKQWHDKCFCCALCKNPIGTKSFIPKNEEVGVFV
jgi:hypothetical protein